MRNFAVAVVLFILFSGCIQQSGNVYMTYTIDECSKEEPTGATVEKAGDVFYIKQVESYVCCANITLTMNASAKTIRIYEENVGEMCRCLCPFKAEIYLYNATGYENVEIYGIKFKDVYDFELMYNYSLVEKGSENKTCKDMCGDGICQEIVCMAIGCPCPETPETCPQDCGKPAEAECKQDSDCVHAPSCCHQDSMECIPKSRIEYYPNCEGVACTLECRQCTECRCKNGKCETIPLPIDVCCG